MAVRASTDGISPRLTLRANFSWTLIGNVVYAGCQWGMLVALAKLGSPEMVGQFALGLAITGPVIMFSSLKLREAQATDVRYEYSFGDYLGLRLVAAALALLAIVGVVVVADYPLETALVVIAVGLAKASESVSDIFYGLFQQQERMDRVAVSMVIRGPLSLIALSAGVYLTGSVFWGAMGLVFTWILVLLCYDVYNGWAILKARQPAGGTTLLSDSRKSLLRPRWDVRTLGKLTWLTLPLGLTVLLKSLDANIPRYFIEGHLGASALGVFAALAYFDRAGSIVVSALGRSATPRLSHYRVAKSSAAFGSLLLKLAGIGLLLGGAGVLVAAVAGEEILTLFYRPEYAKQDVLVLLMAAAGLNYVNQFIMCGPTAARHFRVQLLLYAIVTAVLVLLCRALVPSRGLVGAALALLIARGVESAGASAVAVWVQLRLQRRTSGAG